MLQRDVRLRLRRPRRVEAMDGKAGPVVHASTRLVPGDPDSMAFAWKSTTSAPVIVRRGEALVWCTSKVSHRTGAGGIVDVLCRDFGGVQSDAFMGDVQRVTHTFLLHNRIHWESRTSCSMRLDSSA